MRVEDIDVKAVNLELKQALIIANATSVIVSNVITKVKTRTAEGFGEAAPAEEVTGETQKTCLENIPLLANQVIGKEFSVETLKELRLDGEGNESAKAGIDIGLWDALGKELKKPVYKLLNPNAKENKIRITDIDYCVGIMPPQETLKEVETLVEEGYKRVKIKIGLDEDRDVEAIKLVRDAFPEIILCLDANQGYKNADNTIKFLSKVERFEPHYIEQPVLADRKGDFKKIKENTGIPLMVDESMRSIEDAKELLEAEAVDWLNIKLMKNGGISNTLRIADLAQEYGVPCQIGSMIESNIGDATNTHFYLAHDNVKLFEGLSRRRLKNNVGVGLKMDETALHVAGTGLGVDLSIF